jgi:outer membrane protein TolC
MAAGELADGAAMARAEAARLAAAWKTAGQQVVRYREAILPQTSAALDAARASYLAGRGDFSTVIEDFNLWLQARVQLARREADRFTAWAELVKLTRPSAGSPSQGGQP